MKVPVEFGEWRPDVALLDSKFASEVENVYPGVNSYKPFPGLLPFGPVLPATPTAACGLFAARTSSGSWKIYAGTTTKLYVLVSFAWTDISSAAYSVTPGHQWRFAQFGTKLIAVTNAENPQVVDVDAGGNFAALGGSPPKATNIHVMGDFLVLSELVTTGIYNNRVIQWSAINDITGWTVGTNLSDIQEFPDGGAVVGTAGSEIGYVVQDKTIRTAQFLPGDTTYIFNFSRVLQDRGCISRYGFTNIGNILYFVSEDGFYAITGQQVVPIGADKVNDWWLANSEVSKRDRVLAFSFVDKPRIAWAFHSSGSSQSYYDRLLIYDWSNQRWSHVTEQAQVWAVLASTDLDLDTTGSEPNDADLDSAALSLDSFAYVGGRPLIGAIDESGFLSSLAGPNLPATMETVERHLGSGTRAFVSEVYPLEDGASSALGTIAAGTRERLQDAVVWNPAVGIEITGSAAAFSSARLHRFRRSIPQAATWTHAQGVVVEAQQDGTVA